MSKDKEKKVRDSKLSKDKTDKKKELEAIAIGDIDNDLKDLFGVAPIETLLIQVIRELQDIKNK